MSANLTEIVSRLKHEHVSKIADEMSEKAFYEKACGYPPESWLPLVEASACLKTFAYILSKIG
jgi:hypothetical protein